MTVIHWRNPSAAFIPPPSAAPETFLLSPLLASPETFWPDALLLDHKYFALRNNMSCFPKSEVS